MMSSRLRYSIQGLGFCKVHYNFQNLHLYSTKSPNQSNNSSPNQDYSNYLIIYLGFSPQQALSTSTKFRSKNGNYFNFSDNANSVVNLFKQYGFNDTHIKKIVSFYPRILACNVDKTLIPKFKLLQDHGFSGSNLVSVISSRPSLILRNMYPIPDLRAILVIRNSILQHPEPVLKNTQFFRNILVKVEEELGIPRNSGAFLYGIFLLSKSSKKLIESKCQLLKSFGWTEYDAKVGFFDDREYLATRAALLGYSIEKRLVPRYRVLVLKEKGLLDYNFYTAATKTEKQFLKILIEPFKKDAPGLLELYLSNKGCSNIDAISR
ncbi:uncharacterized protein LOC141594470 [Silene latifolia]|uniref:uncharacterized protein LOC141594470 n=1 Tax=Silene latifolia TaxID=37657 RepID=UPI003D7820F2